MKKLTIIFRLSLLFLVAVSGILSLKAQNGKFTVSGQVCDEQDKKPIPFSTIAISYPDGEKMQTFGQVTDQDGNFRITLPLQKEYIIEASFVGKKFNKIKLIPGSGEKERKLGKIFMHDDKSTQLDELKVTYSKPLVKIDIDRLAYSMKEDKEAQGKNLLDMLRKVPLVTVDGMGNIQIKGSSNYKIYINGKPSPIMDQDPQVILRSIPASTIKKVEVITEPGVKYDAENVGAILNIVTDTAGGDGISGSVNLSIMYPLTTHTGIFLAAKKGRFGISSNLMGYAGKMDKNRTESLYENYKTASKSIEKNTFTNKYMGLFGNILMSYELTPKDLLTLNTDVRPGKYENTSDGTNTTISSDHEKTIFTHNETSGNFGSVSTGLDYQHNTNIDGELFTLSYRYNYTPGNSENKFYQTAEDLSNKIWSKSDARTNEHTIQADYVRPFLKFNIVETGLKYIHRRSSSEPTYKIWDEDTKSWEKDHSQKGIRGSNFLHYYNIYAAYLSYTYKRDNWSVKGGVRAELGKLNVEYDKLPKANFNKDYFDWIPELNFDFKPTQQQQLKFNYNFKLNRPGISALNPYESVNSPYSISQGNPDLEPEKRHNISISYNLFMPKFMMTLTGFYQFTNNSIIQYYEQDKVNPMIRRSKYGNAAKSFIPGLSAFVNWSVTDWLRFISNVNISYNKWESQKLETNVSGWSGTSWLGAMLTFKNDWFINLNGGFYKAAKELQTSSNAVFFNSFSVMKSFMKQKLTVGLTISNPFTKEIKMRSRIRNSLSFEESNRYMRRRTIMLNVNFRFGGMKSQVKRTERTIVNDDIKEISNQSNQNNGNGGGIGGGGM